MAKQSTTLKKSETLVFNTTGELDLSQGVLVDTEDMGVLDLRQSLQDFHGKIVKITVKETEEENLM